MTFQDEQVEQAVRLELERLRVKEEANRRFYEEKLKGYSIPTALSAYDPLPPDPPELIPGILLTSGATGIIAEKETGKTLISLEIQSSLLTGDPLWGEIKPTKTVKRTVHFLGEHTSRKVQELAHILKLPPVGQLDIYGPEVLGASKLLMSSGTRREEAIEHFKKMSAGAGLVVFDPLAAFTQGQGAENDNIPMRGLIDTMIEIAESSKAACLILAHMGKPKFDMVGQKIRKSTYLARGASGIEDALTAVHYLENIDAQFAGDDVYLFRTPHYKGRKRKPFKLLRDPESLRQKVLVHSIGKGI